MRSLLLVVAAGLLAALPLRAQERLVLQERSPGQVAAMRYAPDGSRLAVCFRNDLAVRVYPVAGGPPAVIPAGHDGLVSPVFTPDGRALVCRSPQGVSVHDATTGRERLALTEPGEGGSFAVSPDGRTLAVATGRGTLRLYDFATLEERRTLQRGGGFVAALALSGDGHALATVHAPGVVQVRRDGKEWDRFDLGGKSRNQLWRLTFSPDGSVLAVTNSGRTTLRDLAGHKSLGEFPGDLAAFTPDGKAVAVLEGKAIRLRDLAGRPLRTVPLPAARKQVLELWPGADGRSCVISFSDGEVVVRETPAGDVGADGRSVVLRKAGTPGPVALTSDGRTALVVGADGRLHFHEADARSETFGQELAAEAPAAPAVRVTGLVVAPDGRRAAALLEGGTARLWDVAARREIGGELTLPPTPMAFSFNRGGSVFTAVSVGAVRRWKVATGKPLDLAPAPAAPVLAASLLAWPAAGSDLPAGLAAAVGVGEALRRLEAGHEGADPLTWPLAVGGDALATVTPAGALRLIDLPTGQETELQRPVLPIQAVEFAHDGRLLATLRSDGSVETWDVATGQPAGRPTPPSPIAAAYALLFAPDGRRLLAYGWGTAVVIDRATGKSVTLDIRTTGLSRPQFSADGATISAEGYTPSRRAWDTATGRLLPPPDPEGGDGLPATVVGAAPDGKHVAAALSDGSVLLWDVDRPGEPRRADLGKTRGAVKELRFSPDGRLLAAPGWDGTIRLWDPATGKLLKELLHHKQRVADVAFSPAGRLLAAEASDQSGSLWDVDPTSATFGKLRAVLTDLKAYLDPGLRVWSPDGKVLAVLTTDRLPRTIDTATGAVRHTLPEHDANVLEMAFAADGRTLLVRTVSGRLYAWDGSTGKEVALPAGLPPTATNLAGSRGGWLAVATANRVVLWKGPGNTPAEMAAPGRSGALAFSADGRVLASGGASLRLWRHAAGAWEPVASPGQPEGGPFTLLDVSDEGGAVLLQTGGRGEVLYWDVRAGKGAPVARGGGFATPFARLVPGKVPLALVRTPGGSVRLGNPLDGEMVRLHSPASRVSVSLAAPDGRTAATGSLDGSLRWYAEGDLKRPRYTVDAHVGAVTRLALAPDGKRLLTAGGQDQVCVWDCSGEPKLLRTGVLRNPSAAEWSPEGSKVALATDRGEVELWDVSGDGRRPLQAVPADVHFLSLSRDGRTLLAVDAGNTARVYDTTGKGLLMAFAPVSGAALSPDGSLVATTDAAGVVRLHEARTGKERGPLSTLPPAEVGPAALLFSPDSRTLSVPCRDHFIRHWDLAANAEGAKFPWCNSLIFSGDSRWRVGTTPGGTVNVWDAATGQEKAHWPGGGQLTASADGKLVLLHGPGLPVKLFDVAGGGEPVVLLKDAGYLSRAQLTPDGKTVVAADNTNRLRFWDVARGAERGIVRPRSAPLMGYTPRAVSEDSRWLVVPGSSGGLYLWDVAAGRERAALAPPSGSAFVTHFQLSGDGSTLVEQSNDGSLRVFDARLAEERPPLAGHVGPVAALALSADGKLAATAGEDRTVRLFVPATPARAAAAVLRGSRTPVLGVAISPDGHTIAGASADGTVRLWPADVRDELLTLRGHTGWAVRLRYLPDGKRALSSGGDGLRLWDLDKGTLIRPFAQGHSNGQLDLSADGKRCLSADGLVIREFDLETGGELREFKGLTNATIWVVLYLPGGKEVLAASGDGRILTWDRATGKKNREFNHPAGFPRCGAVSPDGKWLATGDGRTGLRRDAVRVWDLATGKVVRSFGDYTAEVCGVAWSPDGKRLLAAGADATLRVWDPETGKELRRIKTPTWVDSAAWLPDGQRVLSTGNTGDNAVHLWDVESGKELRRFTGQTQPAISVAVAPDGRTALTTGKDGTVRQWSLRPTDPVVLSGHEGEVWSVAFSPDGKLLATAGADRTVRLWDVSGDRERPGYGRLVRTLEGAALGLFAVAFAPDGKRVAAGEGDLFFPNPGAVRLWDVATGELAATLRGHTGAVRALAFSPDGKRLATGGMDNTVRLWDPRDGTSQGALHGHRMAVTGLAFDRDGKLLASAGAHLTAPADGGEVLLWDVAAGRQRGPLVGHVTGLTGVALSPDGTVLYASAYDDSVRAWSLPRPAP